MSGTKHSDTHVEYILDTPTWIGPYGETPYERVEEVARLLVDSGLKAEALRDLLPAQWSKLIFNATVNGVAALTGLPHDEHFAAEADVGDLGHLVHELVDEGKRVAAAAGVELHDDPWEMNVLATKRGQRALSIDAGGRRGAAPDRGRADQRRRSFARRSGTGWRRRCRRRSTAS